MNLRGLHLLLTYQCNLECDHCFVWGSPWQDGTMTIQDIRRILHQARDVGTIDWIYFEGGEPFLYYPILLHGVRIAAHLNFRVGVVSNAYWATDLKDALEWLRPFAGLIQDLSVSRDPYHGSERSGRQAEFAQAAAEVLGIPLAVITIAAPEATGAAPAVGQLPPGESAVMHRGRAAARLVERAARRSWADFTTCPCEDLRDPGRVHVDPFGYVHLCQGIVLGNLFRTPLREICAEFDPDTHPIAGPLLAGGPAELVRRYGLQTEEGYADACHLCYEARRALRNRFPDLLTPDQMYGVPAESEPTT